MIKDPPPKDDPAVKVCQSKAIGLNQFAYNIQAKECKWRNQNFMWNSKHDNWWLGTPRRNVYISNIESLIFLAWTWKRQKGIYTVTQEETCLNDEHFIENDKKNSWENLKNDSVKWTRYGFTRRGDTVRGRARRWESRGERNTFCNCSLFQIPLAPNS